MIYVQKRNGRKVPFDFGKIREAVSGAYRDCGYDKPHDAVIDTLQRKTSNVENNHIFAIEQLQDMVERTLMEQGQYDVAKEYIIYRNNHAESRFLQERIEYMERYMKTSDNAATASETDANANITVKNVSNLEGEVYKSNNRRLQRYRMVKKLEQRFPEVASSYVNDVESHIIYPHDEASTPTLKPYCQAVSLFPFLTEGTSGLDGLKTSAPKNLNSFLGQFNNLVFLLSSQCKGAVAYGELFVCLSYYFKQEFGERYWERPDSLVYLGPKVTAYCRHYGQHIHTLTEARQKVGNDGSRSVISIIHQAFQQITYTINQPASNRGHQSPFTNVSYYDRYFYNALFEKFIFPDGTRPQWEDVSFVQKEYMKWFNEERTKTLLTFPVETMALLTKDGRFLDEEYRDFTALMYSRGHSFFTYISENPNALASCCRLRNEITENTFSFSTGLTGVQTGSCNVITLNISRITQNWARESGYGRDYLKDHFFDHQDAFTDYLKAILERVYKYHIAFKEMLFEVEKAGMLSSCNRGYISISKLYSTVGENGVNEAAEFLGMKCSYNEDYKRFCRLITGTISAQNKAHSKPNFLFNQEFVPAESLSSKNYNWDKADGYWVPEGRVLYNSYFYLADDPSTSILDKFRLHGREFTELLDGGVGLHLNLEEQPSTTQCLKLLDIALANGTSYFTINVPNSECTNPSCHHIVKKPLATCPVCGSPMRQWTRIIGYLRPVDNFDKHRYAESLTRYYAKASSIRNQK